MAETSREKLQLAYRILDNYLTAIGPHYPSYGAMFNVSELIKEAIKLSDEERHAKEK